jgi:hypothetical protein
MLKEWTRSLQHMLLKHQLMDCKKEKGIAVAQALHERTGGNSVIKKLPEDVVRDIALMATRTGCAICG